MKYVLFLIAATVAAQTPVRILDTITDGQGRRINAVLTVSWAAYTPNGGSAVAAGSSLISVTNGALDVSLLPNSVSAVPYTVRYPSPACVETWLVPTSASALSVAAVRSGTSTCVNSASAGSGSSGLGSVGLAMPAEFTVSGSPRTTDGTITAAWATATANAIFAGPTTGSPATPGFRALVAADVPTLTMAKITPCPDGQIAIPSGGAWACRVLTATDIPGLDAVKIISGILPAARLCAGTPSATTYCAGDGVWREVGSGGGSGASSISGLNDGKLTASGATVTAAATMARWGARVFAVTAGTITVSAAGTSQNVYVGVSPTTGRWAFGLPAGVTASCSNADCYTGITAMDPGWIPAGVCTVTSTTFSGCTDMRSILGRDSYRGGTGIIMGAPDADGTIPVSADVTTPQISSGAGAPPGSCTANEIYVRNGTGIYFCDGGVFVSASGGAAGPTYYVQTNLASVTMNSSLQTLWTQTITGGLGAGKCLKVAYSTTYEGGGTGPDVWRLGVTADAGATGPDVRLDAAASTLSISRHSGEAMVCNRAGVRNAQDTYHLIKADSDGGAYLRGGIDTAQTTWDLSTTFTLALYGGTGTGTAQLKPRLVRIEVQP